MAKKYEIPLYSCLGAERQQTLDRFVNGFDKEVPFITFYRETVHPSFSVPSKALKKAIRLGFEPRSIKIHENAKKTLVTIHAFNREQDEAADFCYVLD